MRLSEANRLRLLYFLVFCCTAAWLPIIADFLSDRGLGKLQIAIVLAITPLLMFVAQPYYGMLADRIGFKKCLLVSSILAAISYSLYLFDGGFWFLLFVTAFMSVFYNSIQPLLDSLSLELEQRQPNFSYGKLRIAGAAGWAMTGIVNGQLIDAMSTTVIFAVSAVSMLLTFVVAIGLRDRRLLAPVAVSSSFKNIRLVLSQPALLLLLLAVFLVSSGTSAIWYFYSTYMKENGATASLVGYGLSFQGLCELPLFYFSARIISRLGMKTTLLVTVFASVLRLSLYSIVSNPYAALPIELLHGISWSLFWVVCVEYVNKLVKVEWRATGQSLLYAAYYGAGIIAGNFWTGYLAESNMKISAIYLLNAGILCIVALFIWVFLRKNEVHQETITVSSSS